MLGDIIVRYFRAFKKGNLTFYFITAKFNTMLLGFEFIHIH